jgi:hypothetical protein
MSPHSYGRVTSSIYGLGCYKKPSQSGVSPNDSGVRILREFCFGKFKRPTSNSSTSENISYLSLMALLSMVVVCSLLYNLRCGAIWYLDIICTPLLSGLLHYLNR